jgi:hypothetical protein
VEDLVFAYKFTTSIIVPELSRNFVAICADLQREGEVETPS